jgi:hypothetical protein
VNKFEILFVLYAVACLALVLVYRYYADVFEPKLLGYNLALWYALIPNLLPLVIGILFFREGKKIMALLPIALMPVSIYLFYNSWINVDYMFLAGFVLIPIFLMSFSLYTGWKK